MLIETDHLILREFVDTDLQAMLAYRSDPRYMRYYGSDDVSPDATRRLLHLFLDYQRAEPRTKFQFAVTLRGDGDLIGNVGVREVHAAARQGEMGCEFAPQHWGLGYATEAAGAMLAFGFEQLGLHRIYAETMAENRAAWRVLEKLGMGREGELRETTWLGDHWASAYIYAVLEDEWRANMGRATGSR